MFNYIFLSLVIILSVTGCEPNTNSNEDQDNETPEYNLSVVANPSEAGNVEPSDGTYQEGSEVTIEATANEGWQFVDWTGDQTSDENPIIITITENIDLTANFEQQQSMYSVEMLVTDAANNLELGFGQTENATADFDPGIDEEAPPSPPSGALHAYFTINELNLFQDFRNNATQQTEWRLHYQVGSGQELTLEWNISNNTQIPGTLILTDENNSFEVNMIDQNTHIENNSSGILLIRYSK
jgi:uncharacterized repeat protein (TIGR02543 family)